MNKIWNEKLIKFPIFKTLPKTDVANVKENIDNWLIKNNEYAISNYLIPDNKGYKGYRFVCSEDFDETIITNQIIKGKELTLKFIRRVHTTDHFCPLYFGEWYMDVYLIRNKEEILLNSNNHLLKLIS